MVTGRELLTKVKTLDRAATNGSMIGMYIYEQERSRMKLGVTDIEVEDTYNMLTGRELLTKVEMLEKTATTGAMLGSILTSSCVHDKHPVTGVNRQSVDRGGEGQGECLAGETRKKDQALNDKMKAGHARVGRISRKDNRHKQLAWTASWMCTRGKSWTSGWTGGVMTSTRI